MAGPPPIPRQNPYILVVEDDPELLRMVAKMLETFMEVETADDGQEAFALLKSGTRLPDLIVTDVMMPNMSGLELAKAMKADPKMKNLPIIMLTAKSGPKDVVEGINAGVRHYLTKPFKQDELIDKVKKVLGLK